MITDTSKLREGSRIIAWDGEYKRYFAIAVTKVGTNTCQGICTNFEKHTGLKYKLCWWPEDFKAEKPTEYERLFPAKVSHAKETLGVAAESHAKESATVDTPHIAPPPADSNANLCGGFSGLAISFGWTAQHLPEKTVTRRVWKDNHAAKFIRAYERGERIIALNKDKRNGGEQIGWCELTHAPYKERLSDMPEADLKAEGGMVGTVKEFIEKYFEGDRSLEVWVIRFKFLPPLRTKPDRWNPNDFGEVKRKAEANGQLTIFWENSPEPPDPDDYPAPGDYDRAWEKWIATEIEPIEPVDPKKVWERCANSTCAAESVRDLRSQATSSDSNSPGCANATSIANQFSNSATPECQSTPTCASCHTGKLRKSTYSRVPHRANPFRFKVSALGRKIRAIVSQRLRMRSKSYSPNSSPSKTYQDCSPAHLGQEASAPISVGLCRKFAAAGTMQNGLLHQVPTLERPGLESGCCWLASPTALSCNGNGRPPGLSKCESHLRNLKMLQPGEVLNPDCGEIWSGLPLSWTDPADKRSASEFLAATEQTAIAEKQSATHSIQELPNAPLNESSICNQSQKKQASGWLEQRTERRKLADGSSVFYPKVEGIRDRTIPEHWYWQYCYEEQVCKGRFRRKNVRVSHAKVHAVTTAIEFGWPVEKILRYLKGEL